MGGYEVCRAVKADPALRGVPVILLTSLSDTADVLRGLEAGADYYLTKPYDPAYLLSAVRSILSNAAPAPASRWSPRTAAASLPLEVVSPAGGGRSRRGGRQGQPPAVDLRRRRSAELPSRLAGPRGSCAAAEPAAAGDGPLRAARPTRR